MNHIPFEDAIWVAQSLYDQGLVKGSAGNLSFRWNDRLYISASGSCFGRMTPEDFACLCEGGEIHGKPSKELPLHEALYQTFPDISAVIHVHSTYAVALSCLPPRDPPVPRYTPYLSMKLGAVGLVPYAPPGSQALFSLFHEHLHPAARGYLLANHGAIVAGKSLMDTYNCAMELEESCHLAWLLRNIPEAQYIPDL